MTEIVNAVFTDEIAEATFTDGEQFKATLSEDGTAYAIYLKTFLAWYPVGCAVSIGSGAWETYGRDSRYLGTHDSLACVMGAVHADGWWRLIGEDA